MNRHLNSPRDMNITLDSLNKHAIILFNLKCIIPALKAALRPSRNVVASVTKIGASCINLVPPLRSRPLLSCKICPTAAPARDKLPSKLCLIILSGGEFQPIRQMGEGGDGSQEQWRGKRWRAMSLFPFTPTAFSSSKGLYGIRQSIMENERIATFSYTPKEHNNSRHGSPA